MHSATKRDLDGSEIRRVVGAALGPTAEITSLHEFTDGFFNAVHGVDLADGTRLVLKAAPPPELKLLRYEVDLMRTEHEFFRRAAEAGVPVPALRYADLDGGYLLLDRLSGTSLHALAPRLTPEQLYPIRRELGRISARITTVTGELFGYPRRDGRTRSTSWRTSFLAIVDDILADAVEYERPLPMAAGDIAVLVRRHAPLLDDVTRPALVHFDLWDGNVFVDDELGIEGIIDGERALYGDPLAELVSLLMFQEPDAVPGVLDGFLGRALTDREHLRLTLYNVYLGLILVTEPAVRAYDPDAYGPTYRWAADRLTEQLRRLNSAGP
ncbi:aminoglycoside phosphotransferase family protein [Streptomyces exfoliatus]|uniref:Aminoglycoside phosphotransferase family protein n=1 Tax=Streptomyces exfoliatus TaxID=1905 RepID=A0ABV3D785_STREX